ncbi:methyltransferase-like protein 27 [Acanthaster planci]|uniref:Methyltransferase-like protein 27 n=1 Tax=Acanthaster planci TaxID=133434 RepID=A0A8B7YN73_ACAPL|nr:methyltransferase-like protein 27 [Acanthaster planci]
MAANCDKRSPAEILESYRAEAQIFASNESVADFYNSWARRYDQDTLGGGYKAPVEFAAIAAELIDDKSSRILDAASGTGLIGQELKRVGFTCIDALDPSQASLDQSKEHQSYSEYICDRLDGHKTKIPDNHYNAVLIAAAFGVPGHVDESSFPELIRITNPGGYIMFTVSEKVLEQIEERMEVAIGAHSQQGRWEIVGYRWIQYILNEKLDEKSKVPILRVLAK